MVMEKRLDALLCHLRPVQDLRATAELLEWDQETYMPDGAADARARQVATLRKTAHELFTSDRVGTLLDVLAGEVSDLDPLSFAASLVRITQRDYARAVNLPAALIAELAETTGRAKNAWREARATDQFDLFAPHLDKILELTIRKAEALGHGKCLYDALLDEFEPEMSTAEVADVFGALREELVPIVKSIAACPAPEDAFLFQAYDTKMQWDYGMQVHRDIGYDFARGRQDISTHPFSTSFSITDVRITTRMDERALPTAFFSTLHEAGHALYEQGIDLNLEGTLLADGTSLGIHESQSRLWENQVGRSRPFWRHYYPTLQECFPRQLGSVRLDTFYRGINKVAPSLIRVESDEVTYNLHIMVRFELEQALVDGTLSVAELPEAWNDRMEEYIGIRPKTSAEGVLQDIHWSLGAIGYFPTYTLGNLISAQLFERAHGELPGLMDAIGQGAFGELLQWLRSNVHTHGRKLSAPDILERVTGGGLDATPWLAYIRRKYRNLYDL